MTGFFLFHVPCGKQQIMSINKVVIKKD
uniref:Uncharacterized protein n=1 Tax=Rhizophora mucronata TaxID=61149 RepID=A0A2P2PI54_RHIMU